MKADKKIQQSVLCSATKGKAKPSYDDLLSQNALLLEQIHLMREEMQALRDEVARLKRQKSKPKISPSKMDGKKKKRGKSRRRKRKPSFEADETKTIKATDVPSGSEFKG